MSTLFKPYDSYAIVGITYSRGYLGVKIRRTVQSKTMRAFHVKLVLTAILVMYV